MRQLYRNSIAARALAVTATPRSDTAQAMCGWFLTLLLIVLLTGCQGDPVLHSQAGTLDRASSEANVSALPGISGLAWAGSDTFLAVHDAKHPAEAERPRVSLITLSAPGSGWTWMPLDVDWPAVEGPSSDLESVARIPGTQQFLLVESGSGQKPVPHVYLADRQGTALHIRSATAWPVPVVNVESSAVARLGNTLVFVYAERSAGQDSTALAWSLLSPDALHSGQLEWESFEQASIPNLAPPGSGARAASALAVDAAGHLYVTASYDPGEDHGPFQSSVWKVGRLTRGRTGTPAVLLMPPCRQATLDGLKAEGLAVREASLQAGLFIGTDDEQFGAAFRPLPVRPCSP